MAMALMVLLITMLMAFAGLDEAISSRSLTNRDSRVRRAQQAAEAGAQRVLYEQAEGNIDNWNLNGGPLGLSSTADCLPLTVSSGVITGLGSASVNSAGACPQTTTSGASYTDTLGGDETEQAEFIPGQTNLLGGAERILWPKIVALGTETDPATVYSREEVILQPIAALQAVEGMNNVTLNGLSAFGLGSAAIVNGDVQARNKITLPSLYVGANLSTTQSGSVEATVAAPTISGTLVGTVNGGTVSKGSIPLRQAVSIAKTKSNCPTGGCPAVTGASGSDGYNSSTDTLTMTKATESVSFSSGDYVFCNVNVTAGTINVAPTASAPVRLFVDSPTSSRCANDGLGASQGNFIASKGINNTLSGTTAPSGLQIYVAGDGSYDDNTSVTIGDTCVLTCLTQSMVIYAPTSAVTVSTGTTGIAGTFDGAVVGNDVSLTAGEITQDLDLGNYPIYDGVQVFRAQQYVECTPQPTDSHGNTYTTLQANPSIDLNGC